MAATAGRTVGTVGTVGEPLEQKSREIGRSKQEDRGDSGET
jgi:hypothetical protein